jgi:hypothetical protein
MMSLFSRFLLQALNEFDLRATDWRKKLESQRGAVLAFETKNNLAKIAKWTMCALLAGADMVKLGYVSRAGPKDNSNHVILGTQVRLGCLVQCGLSGEGICLVMCLPRRGAESHRLATHDQHGHYIVAYWVVVCGMGGVAVAGVKGFAGLREQGRAQGQQATT